MKVIDLINDLFNYREFRPDKLPKKIRFNNEEFVFKDNSYYHENGINIMRYIDHTIDLRVKIEVLEEDKEIEDIDKEMSKLQSEIDLLSNEIGSYHNKIHSMRDRNNYMKETLKDLRKAVNELKKGK